MSLSVFLLRLIIMLSILLLLLLASHVEAAAAASSAPPPASSSSSSDNNNNNKLVPAMFIFGDSTVDTGNNNQLWTVARADYYPFGRDFDTHQATGRFSNGRLSVDYLASFLDLPLAPAYLEQTNAIFEHGVNFASAGCGILNSTGDVFGEHVSMQEQLHYFMDVRERLETVLGTPKASNLISKSIFYLSVGTNDYLKNYFNADSYYANKYTQAAFQDLLLESFSQIIQKLYDLGARKIVVASLSPMGCIPSQLEKFRSVNGSPVTSLNLIAQNYNEALLILLLRLQLTLPGAQIVYNNVYDLLSEITSNPTAYGFKFGDSACCGIGIYGGAVPCLPDLPVCKNASEYVFWDEFHPTSATYYLLARTFWQGSLQYSFPVNVKQMASQ